MEAVNNKKRAWLEIDLKAIKHNIDHLTKNLDETGVDFATEVVNYLRETYPRIEILSSDNKKVVLNALNDRYNTTFKESDIWSSRTTVSNQFGYLKNHLSMFPEIFQESQGIIELNQENNVEDEIDKLLLKTKAIEVSQLDQLHDLYINYQGWLD